MVIIIQITPNVRALNAAINAIVHALFGALSVGEHKSSVIWW
jgi:hypothetical protein